MVEYIVIILLIIHLAITAVIFGSLLPGKSKQEAVCKSLVVLFIPIFGILYYCADLLLTNRLPKKNSVNAYDFTLQQTTDTSSKNMDMIDYDEDTIPIRDVITIDGISGKRNILINTIRQNLLTDYDTLVDAMHDKDREISHYAVSVITHKVDTLEAAMFSLKKSIYDKDGRIIASVDVLKKYETLLHDYIKVCSMDEVSRQALINQYEDILNKILTMAQEPVYFEKAITVKIQQKDFDGAKACCALYEKTYPRSERPYIFSIKLYASVKERTQLTKKLEKLKALPSILSNEALQLIRYWDIGDKKHV